jgi:D-alanine-D-alanine ligase
MNSSERLRVGVVFGGRSGEHAVSLMSARSVLAALDPAHYAVTEIGITLQGDWVVGENILEALTLKEVGGLGKGTILPDPTRTGLYSLEPTAAGEVLRHLVDLDLVFPVLHGTFGEDGTLQGLFEMAELAYVGAGVLGSAVGMDKGIFKDVMRANDIPVLDSMILRRSEINQRLDHVLNQAEALAPYPLFTKPANLGSSVGISKCHNRSDLVEGIMEAAQYDRRILIERGVNGREIEVSVLGNDSPEASVPGEIVPAAEFYTYEAKYHNERSQLLIPAPIPEAITTEIRELAIRAYKAVDCAGMARVDFLLDRADSALYLNELNTIPGFTEISMYSKLWEATELSYPELVDRLIDLALERRADRARTIFSYQREQ